MDKKLLDVISYDGEGYVPLIDFEKWRVATLRYCDDIHINNLKEMQKHSETDEVFVLLSGDFTLFIGGNGDTIEDIQAVKLEPLKFYNVKKGTYHTHASEPNAMVLIVENQDTNDNNSPTIQLSDKQKDILKELYLKVNKGV